MKKIALLTAAAVLALSLSACVTVEKQPAQTASASENAASESVSVNAETAADSAAETAAAGASENAASASEKAADAAGKDSSADGAKAGAPSGAASASDQSAAEASSESGAADAAAGAESAQAGDASDAAGTADAGDAGAKSDPTSYEGADINIAVLAGPTGIGAVGLMEAAENGESINRYSFTLASANDEIVAGIASGSLDIAAVATNVASNLYNKTNGNVKLCALNTYGVLYILENGDSVSSIADLKGHKLYATGQGANPEYVLEYILDKNGLSYSIDGSDADVQIEFMASDALTAGMVSGSYDLCMLPVPAVTSVELQNKDVRTALNLTDEWNAVSDEGVLTMGSVIVRKAFAESDPEAVDAFLYEYEKSIDMAKTDTDHAAELCEKYGIVPKAAVAKKAIPDCNLRFVSGADIKPAIEPYYNVLFSANPQSIGGKLPADDFYYVSK